MIFAENDATTYRDLTFPEPPPDRPFIFINMVASLDGKAVVEDNEKGLGSKADQALMRRLRAHADMVLNGAGTFRKSGAGSRIGDASLQEARARRGLPPNPIAAVVTNRAGLDTSRQFFTADDYDAVVFLGPDAGDKEADRLAATGRHVVRIPAGEAGLLEMVAAMRRDFGVRYLLLEGGPTLNSRMLHLQLIDEFFLTQGGRIVGGRDTLTIVEGTKFALSELPNFEPLSVIYNDETRELYLRWRRVPALGG